MDKPKLTRGRWILDVVYKSVGPTGNSKKWHWTISLYESASSPICLYKKEGNGQNRLDAFKRATRELERYERGFAPKNVVNITNPKGGS
jgi:hypothetical protein